MPAVQSLPEMGVGQLAEIEIIRAADQGRARVADPEYGRQRLRRPEDGLLVERLVRVSREKKAPIAIETSRPRLKAIEHSAACDSLLGNRYCGEDTPKQNRRFRQLPFARKPSAIANQTPTSYYFSHALQTKLAARRRCLFFIMRSAPYLHSQLTTTNERSVHPFFQSRSSFSFKSSSFFLIALQRRRAANGDSHRWSSTSRARDDCRMRGERDQAQE